MNERYDKQIIGLRARLDAVREKESLHCDAYQLNENVRKQVRVILSGGTDSEVFYRNLLEQMTVFRDARVEVRLNLLPMKWIFALERAGAHSDPSVPISVSNA